METKLTGADDFFTIDNQAVTLKQIYRDVYF